MFHQNFEASDLTHLIYENVIQHNWKFQSFTANESRQIRLVSVRKNLILFFNLNEHVRIHPDDTHLIFYS